MQKHCITCPQQGFVSESFSCWHERYLKILLYVNGMRVNPSLALFYSSLSPLDRSPLYTTITIHILHYLFFPFYPNAHALVKAVLPSFLVGPSHTISCPLTCGLSGEGSLKTRSHWPSRVHLILRMVEHISRCCPISNSVAQLAGLLSKW